MYGQGVAHATASLFSVVFRWANLAHPWLIRTLGNRNYVEIGSGSQFLGIFLVCRRVTGVSVTSGRKSGDLSLPNTTVMEER